MAPASGSNSLPIRKIKKPFRAVKIGIRKTTSSGEIKKKRKVLKSGRKVKKTVKKMVMKAGKGLTDKIVRKVIAKRLLKQETVAPTVEGTTASTTDESNTISLSATGLKKILKMKKMNAAEKLKLLEEFV